MPSANRQTVGPLRAGKGHLSPLRIPGLFPLFGFSPVGVETVTIYLTKRKNGSAVTGRLAFGPVAVPALSYLRSGDAPRLGLFGKGHPVRIGHTSGLRIAASFQEEAAIQVDFVDPSAV